MKAQARTICPSEPGSSANQNLSTKYTMTSGEGTVWLKGAERAPPNASYLHGGPWVVMMGVLRKYF